MSRVVSYPTNVSCAEVADSLAEGFDTAPVTRNGQVCGYVRRAEVVQGQGCVEPYVHTITANTVVSGDTALAALMRGLRGVEFLFVVEGHNIVGLVTPSDLNKQPGRTYFYLLVAALELRLAQCVRTHFVQQGEALALVSSGRQEKIKLRLTEEARADVVADTVAAMDFTDLFTIVEKTDALREAFGQYSRRSWQSQVSTPILELRHDVMHVVRTLTSDAPTSLQRMISLDDLLRALLAT